MNITLGEVIYQNPGGVQQKFSTFFVPNRLVRIVQIPPEIDIRQGLEDLFRLGPIISVCF